MDRPGLRQVPEGSEEQEKMEKTGFKINCGAPTTLAVKGLMMMMMMMMMICVCVCAALQAAIKERDLKTLEAAIEAARKSSVAPELRKGETLREAESLRSLLRRLKLYLHKILEMKQPTVSEIHSYTRPRPLVHTVMKATYLLLGEKERQLQASA